MVSSKGRKLAIVLGFAIIVLFFMPWFQMNGEIYNVFTLVLAAKTAGGFVSFLSTSYLKFVENETVLAVFGALIQISFFIPVAQILLIVLKWKNKSTIVLEGGTCFSVGFYVCVLIKLCGGIIPGTMTFLLIMISIHTIQFLGIRAFDAQEEIKKNIELEGIPEKEEKYRNPYLLEGEKRHNSKYMTFIFWKNFTYNIRNFFVFIFSGSISIAIILNSYLIVDVITKMTEAGVIRYSFEQIVTASLSVMYAFTILLLVFSILYYIKTRMKDYGMYLILGIQKKTLVRFVLTEYIFGWICSVLIGLMIGTLSSTVFRSLMEQLYSNAFLSLHTNIVVYLKTVGWSFVIFFVAFAAEQEMISCIGLQEVLQADIKKGKRPMKKKFQWFTLLGVGLVVLAIYLLGTYFGRNGYFVPIVMALVGMYLLFIFGGSGLLNLLTKSKSYYRKLLSINTFYYRYMRNVQTLFLVFTYTFILTYTLFFRIADSLPLEASKDRYPYDLVWIGSGDGKNFEVMDAFQREHAIAYQSIPCIKIASSDKGEQIGVTASVYESWTGKSIDLKGNEISIIYQWDDQSKNSMKMSADAKTPNVHIGKGEERFWYQMAPIHHFFSDNYVVKEEQIDNVFGIFREPSQTNIIVFSDTYYKKVESQADASLQLMLVDYTKDKDSEEIKQVKEYAKEHTTVYFGDDTADYYEKYELLKQYKLKNTVDVTANSFIISILIFSNLFILGTKIASDIPMTKKKYEFLFCMGMKKKDRLKCVGKELKAMIFMPVFLGVGLGGIFIVRELLLRDMGNAILHACIGYLSIFIVAYSCIILVFYLIMRGIVNRSIGGKNEYHRG
ncbi:FtsX-like permease family protein [Lachnospiraceae bacterium LCP25S3_G4]